MDKYIPRQTPRPVGAKALMDLMSSQRSDLPHVHAESARAHIQKGSIGRSASTINGIFAAWVFSRHDHDASLAWVGYLFCLPGAAVGEILALLWLRGAIAAVGIAASTPIARHKYEMTHRESSGDHHDDPYSRFAG
jgi:hypothetical protein